MSTTSNIELWDWSNLMLKGLERISLLHRFSVERDGYGEVLVWHVQVPGLEHPLTYGMSPPDLGALWGRSAAFVRLRKLAEAELRKDLYFLERREVPDALFRVVIIDVLGRRKDSLPPP